MYVEKNIKLEGGGGGREVAANSFMTGGSSVVGVLFVGKSVTHYMPCQAK